MLIVGLIIDHFGLSERASRSVLTTAIRAMPLVAGLRAANSDLSRFFCDGRSAPAQQNRYALGALILALTLMWSQSGGLGGAVLLLAGGILALIVQAFFVFPAVQRSEAISARQWLEKCFDHRGLRVILALAVFATTFALVVWAMDTAAQMLANAFALPRGMSVAVAAALAAVWALSGGAATALAVLSGAWIVALGALLMPLMLQGFDVPFAQLWPQVWQVKNVTQIGAITYGLIGMPVLMMPALASQSVQGARRAGIGVILSLIAASVLAFLLIRGGVRLDSDANYPDTLLLIGGFIGPMSALQPFVESLSLSATILLALALTMASLTVLAANISEGSPVSPRDFKPLSSTRIALSRFVAVVAAGLAGFLLVWRAVDARFLLQIAIGVAAMGLAPAVLIGCAGRQSPSTSLTLAYGVSICVFAAFYVLHSELQMQFWLLDAVCYSAASASVTGLLTTLKSDRTARS